MGTATVGLIMNDHDINLTIEDDGFGFPENLDHQDTVYLGLQLFNNLIRQIDGEITMDRANGTKFKIKFRN